MVLSAISCPSVYVLCNNQPSEIIIMHNNFKFIGLDFNVINYTNIIIIPVPDQVNLSFVKIKLENLNSIYFD